MNRSKTVLFLSAFLGAAWGAAAARGAGDAPQHHHEHGADAQDDHDHAPPEKSSAYEVSTARYATPKISLTDQYGRKVRVDQLLSEDRPMLVQFIFTSCTTICPLMGAVFGGAQEDIAAVAPDYRMVSISIDPEYDTPEKLREFAAKQNARPDWVFLTGTADDITKVTKSFDALNQGDNKMYHQPFTFIRWRKDGEWVRIRGLLSVADLVNEFSSAQKAGTR